MIYSDEDLNTNNLIENAEAIVLYISAVGTEAAALGKIVVSVGASSYAELEFSWTAKTKHKYFVFLSQVIIIELKLSID